ncbi:hypothetical protein NKG94_43045 [Micromonospora sp. M12]
MVQIALALARFARGQGELYLNLAAELEAAAQVPDLTADPEVEIPTGRGQRQQQILAVPGLAAEDGMKTADIAAAISYDGPNTHTSLQALHKAGLVELVPAATRNVGAWPPVIAPPASSSCAWPPVSVQASGRPTETSRLPCAAIPKRPEALGRPPQHSPPSPSRTSPHGGRAHQSKVARQSGRGPEYCRQLLEDQGVRFDNDLADLSQRVTWDELRRRDESEPVTE